MNGPRGSGHGTVLVGVALALLLRTVALAHAATVPVRVFLNDSPIALTTPPVRQGDLVYLPLRVMAQQFQASVTVDKDTVEVRRPDGIALVLRLGRREIWSEGLVMALAEAPVVRVNGVTMITPGTVEALFDVLTVWSREDRTLFVTSRETFTTKVVARPTPRPVKVISAITSTFVPEFQPELERPLLASGRVTVGLATGRSAGIQATSRLSFRADQGPTRVDGAISMAAGDEPIVATGTVSIRRPGSFLTLGGFSVSDSPLTLYDQGLLGIIYAPPPGGRQMQFFGGNLPSTAAHVYGFEVVFPSLGEWLLGGTFLYDPASGALIGKVRTDRSISDRVTVFGETAAGSSLSGSGSAWRVGVSGSAHALEASISYLSLGTEYPTIGNAALFAGRRGPLVELAYHPNAPWSLQVNAAVLRGAAPDVPDRLTYGAAFRYAPSPSVMVVTDLRTVVDTASGTRTHSTTANVAVSYIRDPYNVVFAASHVVDIDLTAGTSATTTFSLRAGAMLRSSLPVWVELLRQSGSTDDWGLGLGATFHVSPQLDLSAQVRHKVYALPSPSAESSFELGMIRPLASGAQLTLGGGLRYTTGNPATTPYLAVQYGYPVSMYGELRAGRVGGMMFIDRNGNGRMDPGEPGVPGVVLRVDGRTAAISSEAGEVSVNGVREGERTVSVDQATIPVGLALPALQRIVHVTARRETTLAFPFAPAASLHGVVFLDENGNGVRDRGERSIGGIVLLLQPTGLFRTADADGTFDLASLSAGEYRLIVDQRALPPGIKVKGDGLVVVMLNPGTTTVVEIPVLDTRPIIRTF